MPIRKDQEYETIINRGEYHIPVAVVLDVSWKDKEEYKRMVSQAIAEFLAVAKEDSFASGRFDICLIAGNNGGQILNPFCPPAFLTVPSMGNLDQCGECDIDTAVQKAVDQIEQRIHLYKTNGVSSYNPALYIFSSRSNLHFDNTTVTLVNQKKKHWNMFYYVIPLNNHDYYKLDDLMLDYIILPYSTEKFQESFDQISLRHSVSVGIAPRNKFHDEQFSPPAPKVIIARLNNSDFDYLKGVRILQETAPYIKAIDDTLTTKNIPHQLNWTEEGVCTLEFDANCTENGILVFFKGKLVKISLNADEKLSVDSIRDLPLSEYNLLKINYALEFNASSYVICAEYNMYVHGNPDDFSEYLLEMIKRFKEEWDTLTQTFADDKHSVHTELPPAPSNFVVGI